MGSSNTDLVLHRLLLRRAKDGGLEEKDLVREYSRSFKGRLALSGSSSVVGAALAAIISQVGLSSVAARSTLVADPWIALLQMWTQRPCVA